MGQSEKQVSVSRAIAADAQRLFDIVAEPGLHHVIDGSGTVKGTKSNAKKLAVGDKFATSMRLGVPYRMTNKVIEFVDGEVIAWAHIGGWRWRYRFEPVTDGPDEGSTLVTETFDWSHSKAGAYLTLLKWPERNRSNMEKTLARLDAFVRNTTPTL